MTARLTPDQLAQLVDLAHAEAVDVRAYALPLGRLPWDEARVGRMIARDMVIAQVLPIALAELALLARNRVERDRAIIALTARVAELLAQLKELR